MPRPVKRRRVCEPPRNARFGPLDGAPAESVVLAVDEYETIRLIDLLGLTQEECAGQMGVARTTVQALYEAARAKLADMLVNGRLLHVEGGPYELCPRAGGCRGKRCAQSAGGSAFCARYQTISEDANMKIAVTYENGLVFQHFGHTQQFKLYTVENGKITSSEVVDTNGSGHGALAVFLNARRGHADLRRHRRRCAHSAGRGGHCAVPRRARRGGRTGRSAAGRHAGL